MINIVLIEDLIEHQNYLKTIIESTPDIHCMGIMSTGTDAINQIPLLKPEIVLVDIGLPDMSGIECILKIKLHCPEMKFMICTIHDEDENIFEALKAGANSYMLKTSKPHQIIDAIHELSKGGAPISSDIARKVLNNLVVPSSTNSIDEQYHITTREKEILAILAQGYTYQEVSDKLFIHITTLNKHIYNIYRKLQVNNRTEAINKYFGANSNKA